MAQHILYNSKIGILVYVAKLTEKFYLQPVIASRRSEYIKSILLDEKGCDELHLYKDHDIDLTAFKPIWEYINGAEDEVIISDSLTIKQRLECYQFANYLNLDPHGSDFLIDIINSDNITNPKCIEIICELMNYKTKLSDVTHIIRNSFAPRDSGGFCRLVFKDSEWFKWIIYKIYISDDSYFQPKLIQLNRKNLTITSDNINISHVEFDKDTHILIIKLDDGSEYKTI